MTEAKQTAADLRRERLTEETVLELGTTLALTDKTGHRIGALTLRAPSLGMTLYIARQARALEMDSEMLRLNPALESARQVEIHRAEVVSLIATAALWGRDEVIGDSRSRRSVERQLARLADDALSSLLLAVMQPVDVSELLKLHRLDKEREYLRRAVNARSAGSTLDFGGLTIWGGIIDSACERYGWTMDYVLWGISLANLQMLMADRPTSVYLTDKERRGVHVPSDRSDVIRAEDADPATLAKLFHH